MREIKKSTLDYEDLALGSWRLAIHEDPTLCLSIRFHEDGNVDGLQDIMGSRWIIHPDGKLKILRADGFHILEFEEVFIFSEEAIIIGKHKPSPSGNSTVAWLQRMTPAFSFLIRWTAFLMRGEIENNDWEIGAYTYGHPRIHDGRLAKLKIGRFCSIAENVNIALGNHRTEIASTYPFQTLKSWVQDWQGAPDEPDHTTKGDVVIGSDVWIATGVFIASGVNIGHGAVLAAESVVTKDVPPYAIVAGNPARVIRYRFDSEIIRDLLEIQWWNWSAEKINSNLSLIISGDVERFISENRSKVLREDEFSEDVPETMR